MKNISVNCLTNTCRISLRCNTLIWSNYSHIKNPMLLHNLSYFRKSW